jgi:hypothetical protein
MLPGCQHDGSMRGAAGELHNNLRMKWGKAFLGWLATPDEAIAAACHVNHKFALDGCDPCSYGGILWCFGLFDQPKCPESTPVSGVLRRMPTSGLTNRLNWDAYRSLAVVPFSGGGSSGDAAGGPVMGSPSQATIKSFFKPLPKKQRTG